MKILFIIFIPILLLSSCNAKNSNTANSNINIETSIEKVFTPKYWTSFHSLSNEPISATAEIRDINVCCASVARFKDYYERSQNINVTYQDGDDIKKKSFIYTIRFADREAASISNLKVEGKTKFKFTVRVSKTTEEGLFVILDTISETRSLFD